MRPPTCVGGRETVGKKVAAKGENCVLCVAR